MKLILVRCLLTLMITACRETPAVKTGFEGKEMPSFSLLLPDSTTYINTSDIPKGKATILLYFSPECPYCRAQIKDIVENMSFLNNVNILLFTTWPFEEMKSFYTQYKLSEFKNLATGVDFNNYFKYHFKAFKVPFLTIYGSDRKLKSAYAGRMRINQLIKTLHE